MQSCHILDLVVETTLFETIFNFLDILSISRLESCCPELRDMVVQTRIYRKMFQKISRNSGDEDLTQEESSKHFKKQLSDYYIR